jgi:hypothetical protein
MPVELHTIRAVHPWLKYSPEDLAFINQTLKDRVARNKIKNKRAKSFNANRRRKNRKYEQIRSLEKIQILDVNGNKTTSTKMLFSISGSKKVAEELRNRSQSKEDQS